MTEPSELAADRALADQLLGPVELMRDFPGLWGIAGGWAIDLFVGTVTREHEDIEIVVARQDQQILHRHLEGWYLQKVVPTESEPSLVVWVRDDRIEPPIFQIVAHNSEAGWPEFHIFLNEIANGEWRSRRNPAITRPADKLIELSADGIPFVAPEIQLLYKAKHHRPKDDLDFRAVLPLLSPERRLWLRHALDVCYGHDPWLTHL